MPSSNLDTRLLRFRSQTGQEDAAALARALLETGRTDEALEVALTGLEERPLDGALLLLEGESWFSGGDLLRAQAALLKAAKADPDDLRVFRLLGEVLLKRGDPARAHKVLERGLALAPGDDKCQRLLGRAERLCRIAETSGSVAPTHGGEKVSGPTAASDAAARVSPAPSAPRVPPVGEHPFSVPPSVPSNATVPSKAPRAAVVAAPAPGQAPRENGFRTANAPAAAASPGEVRARAPTSMSAPRVPAVGPRSRPEVTKHALLSSIPPDLDDAARPSGGNPRFGSGPAWSWPSPASAPPAAGPQRPAFWSEDLQEDVPTNVRPSPLLEEALPPVISPVSSSSPPPLPSSRDYARDDISAAPGLHRAPKEPLRQEHARTAEPQPEAARPARESRARNASPDPRREPDLRSQPDLRSHAGEPKEPEWLQRLSGSPASSALPAARGGPALRASDAPAQPAAPAARHQSPAAPANGAGTTLEDLAIRAFADAREAGPVPGDSEGVDAILEAVRAQGLFEEGSARAAEWVSRRDAKPLRLRVGRGLAVLWLLAVLLAVGGYFAWESWTASRRKQAATWTETAHQKALAGDHADLVDAERLLVQAKGKYPLSFRTPLTLLFVHGQRALDDGRFSPGYLRRTMDVAKHRWEEAVREPSLRPVEADAAALEKRLGATLRATEAIVAVFAGDEDAARKALRAAEKAAPGDPVILYFAGRSLERLGDAAGTALLDRAHQAEPKLAAATLALVGIHAAAGEREEALALLADLDEVHPDLLRARLYRQFLEADTAPVAEGLAAVEGLAERAKQHGAATDHVLHALAMAQFARRKGDFDGARKDVARAIEVGVTEPRLLRLVAQQALGVGELNGARRAASSALAAAPQDTAARKLLARILLAQRDGKRALTVLAPMPMEDSEVLLLSAEAALLVRSEDTLSAAVAAITERSAEGEGLSVPLEAMVLRLRAAQGQGRDALSAARRLLARAPNERDALLAVADVAIAAGQPSLAQQSLETLLKIDDSDAEGHLFLGRTLRMLGNTDAAVTSLERTLSLAPHLTEARFILGRLLLDSGRFDRADALFTATVEGAHGSSTAYLGRLGLAAARLGLRDWTGAKEALAALTEEELDRADARQTSALLALAEGRAADALLLLAPLTEGERVSVDAMTLHADALLAVGRNELALTGYERALERDPGFVEALIGRGELLVRAERPRDAREFLQRAEEALKVRVRPPALWARLQRLLGRSYLQDGAGGRAQAERHLKRAVELAPTSAEGWFFLGEALSGADVAGSREAYEKYLILEPEGSLAARARRAVR